MGMSYVSAGRSGQEPLWIEMARDGMNGKHSTQMDDVLLAN